MDDALKKLETLLQGAGTGAPTFPPNSRYHDVGVAKLVRPDGTELVYLKRRFVPAPERFATLVEHGVQAGDRLDLLAAQYLGDPELYWRLCDANGALRPDELTEAPGARLRIPLPEGAPGDDGA